MKTITIKEALRQGFEYFFSEGNEDHCYKIRSDAEDYLNDGEKIYLAEPVEFMTLDPQNIIENATDGLHEAAYDNVVGSKEYELFKTVCEYITQSLKYETQSYRITDIRIRK